MSEDLDAWPPLPDESGVEPGAWTGPEAEIEAEPELGSAGEPEPAGAGEPEPAGAGDPEPKTAEAGSGDPQASPEQGAPGQGWVWPEATDSVPPDFDELTRGDGSQTSGPRRHKARHPPVQVPSVRHS